MTINRASWYGKLIFLQIYFKEICWNTLSFTQVLYVKAGADGKRYGACPFCQVSYFHAFKYLYRVLNFTSIFMYILI